MKKKLVYRPSKFLCLFFFFIPLFFCLCSNMRLDNDTWFLLRSGRYVLSHGIPSMEPFTIHQGFSFVMQQVLTGVIFAKVYEFGGGMLLAFLVVCLFVLFSYLFYRLCFYLSDRNFYLSFILTFIIALFLSRGYFVARPQIFSYIHYILLFWALEHYVKEKKSKYLFLLPAISFFEMQLHGATWWMLLCFVLPYLVECFPLSIGGFEKERYSFSPLLLAICLMFVSACFNPYGFASFSYLFLSFGNPILHLMIREMKLPTVKTFLGKVIYASVFIVLGFYIKNKKPVKIRYACLLLGTIFLTLTTYRSFPYFLIATIFPLASYCKDKISLQPIPTSRKYQVVYVIFLVISITCCCIFFKRNYQMTHPLDGIVSYLDATTNKTDVILYTSFDSGSYMEFQGYKVYIDPRAEVFSKKLNHQYDVLAEYYYLQSKGGDIKAFLKRYPFTHLLVTKKDNLYSYLKDDPTYQLVYHDQNYFLYCKIS